MTDQTLPTMLDVVRSVCESLNKLEPAQRTKAISMVLLAFDVEPPKENVARATQDVADKDADAGGSGSDKMKIRRKARHWMSKFDISEDTLGTVFEAEKEFELIGHLPDGPNRAKTINCYLLVGLQQLLRTDDPAFKDAEAVALCKAERCHDPSNHPATRNAIVKQKYVHGSKETGFALSSVGLEKAAALVKEMATE